MNNYGCDVGLTDCTLAVPILEATMSQAQLSEMDATHPCNVQCQKVPCVPSWQTLFRGLQVHKQPARVHTSEV